MQPSRVRVPLATAGLALTVALGLGTHPSATAQAPPASKGPPILYQKSRSFRVPFQLDPADQARRRELQLWSSQDQGRHWKQQGVTTPDRPAFTFNVEQDGEYWLAVRTLDIQGRLFPADDARIEPSMRIVVDTTPPALVLEPKVRSVSLASVRWEARDEHPAAQPPVLEYQVEGQSVWHPVPPESDGTPGVATWDSGFAQPLSIRLTAIDLAGNKAEKTIRLGSSQPGPTLVVASGATAATATSQVPAANPGPQPSSFPTLEPAADSTLITTAQASPTPPPATTQAPGPVAMPAPVPAPTERLENPGQGNVAGRPEAPDSLAMGLTPGSAILPSAQEVAQKTVPSAASSAPQAIESPVGEASASVKREGGAPFATQMGAAPFDLRPAAIPPSAAVQEVASPPQNSRTVAGGASPGHQTLPGGGLEKPANSSIPKDQGSDPDVGIAAMMELANSATAAQSAASPSRAVSPSPNPNTIKVPGPRFLLDYAVDHAGPDGRPAVVEIWMTADGGKTWSRNGIDPDRASPVLVEVKGEGTFGLSLIARDANGLGDKPPAPGDVPKMWIEVEPQALPQPQSQLSHPQPQPQPPTTRSPNILQRMLRR